MPKVLQAKARPTHQPVNQTGRVPIAPPVYRPQTAPQALQPKMPVAAPAPNRLKVLPVGRPEPKMLQTKLPQHGRAAVQMKTSKPPVAGQVKLFLNALGLPPLETNRKVQKPAVIQCDRYRSRTSTMRVEVTMSKGRMTLSNLTATLQPI